MHSYHQLRVLANLPNKESESSVPRNNLENSATNGNALAVIKTTKAKQPGCSTTSRVQDMENPDNISNNNNANNDDFILITKSVDPFLLRNEDITIKEEIGRGGYGKVYVAYFNGQKVAAKVLELNKENPLKDCQQEKDIMAQLTNAQLTNAKMPVVKLYGYIQSPTAYVIVMEYLNRGSVFDLIINKQISKNDWKLRKKILTDALQGLAYMHQLNILHRDIKAANIFINAAGDAVLGDFGLAGAPYLGKQFSLEPNTQDKPPPFGGTPAYSAPEVVKLECQTKKSDIWSFGITTWEICEFRVPHENKSPQKAMIDVSRGLHDPINKKWPTFFQEVIISCRQGEQDKRPDAEKLLNTFKTTKL